MVEVAARAYWMDMDFDLDMFDRSRRGRRHRDRRASSSGGWSRRAHPHVFAWLLLGGGVVLLGLAVVAILSSLGLWGYLADAYFAAAQALLPAGWYAPFADLPGIAHVAILLGALFVLAGLAGEVFD